MSSQRVSAESHRYAPRGDQVRPDQVVPRPVLRVIDVTLPGARARQNLVPFVHHLVSVLVWFRLRPDGGLDESVHLDGVAAPVYFSERGALDVPDQLAQDRPFAQPGVVGQQGADHFVAVQQGQRDRVGGKVRAQLEQPGGAGDRSRSRSYESRQVIATDDG